MRRIKFARSLAVIVSLMMTAVFTEEVLPYGPDKTHTKTTVQTLKHLQSVDTEGLYKEAYHPSHLDKMRQGSRDQDYGSVAGNGRGFRHYYDPDSTQQNKGVQYHDYYMIWMAKDLLIEMARNALGEDYGGGAEQMVKEYLGFEYEGTEVTPPPGGYYPGALEWARNSALDDDVHNWEGALEAYDYTSQSRLEAYYRLGHVVHLLQDMAEPDHAYNIPHPGSSSKVVKDNTVYYGFERLIDEVGFDITPSGFKRRDDLDTYYNEMARHSKKGLTGTGLTVPLGLNPYMKISDKLAAALRAGGYVIPGLDIAALLVEKEEWYIPDIAWDPDIDYANTDIVMRYVKLGQALLTYAAELSVGLVMDFYDIVNQPPYAASVTVTQDFEELYSGAWQDNKAPAPGRGSKHTVVSSRELEDKRASPVKANTEAVITVAFGPTARLPVRIDPASVQVFLGEEEAKGAMLDERTWQGTVTPRVKGNVKEEEQKIRIYAKDISNHYPRQGLPTKGYELDSDPSTPPKLAKLKPPYPWDGQYKPGWDETHKVKVKKELGPPIVQEISVYYGDKSYKRSSWKWAEGQLKAQLVEDRSVIGGGVNLAEQPIATVKIVFDKAVSDGSVDVLFGPLNVGLSKIDDKTYEGTIHFYKLRKPKLDEMHAFTINAKNELEMPLDGVPETVAYKEKGMAEWGNYEKAADTNHKLRVFGEIEGEIPVLKGCVFETPLRSLWSPIQDLSLGFLLYEGGRPPDGSKPLANFTVMLGLCYGEIGDAVLFEKFKRLANTSVMVQRKYDNSIRRFSPGEIKECLEFHTLRMPMRDACKFKAGSKPGWVARTDSKGEFTFLLEKYPLKENVPFVMAGVFAVPPAGEPAKHWFVRPVIRYYAPGYNDFLRKIFAADGPDKDGRLKKLSSSLGQLEEEVRALEEAVQKIKDRPFPDNIEKAWTERALKDQRELEKQYIAKNGSWDTWTEETRGKFEEELAEVPKKSKASWEEDVKAFKAEKEKDLKDAKSALEAKRSELSRTRDELKQGEDAVRKAREKDPGYPLDTDGWYDVLIASPAYRDGRDELLFEIDGAFSGQAIQVPARWSYNVTVFLVKQVVDGFINEKRLTKGVEHSDATEIHGRDVKDGDLNAGFSLDYPEWKKTEPPPFEFKMDQPVADCRVIYCFKGQLPEPKAGYANTGVESVRTVFYGYPWVAPGYTNLITDIWCFNNYPSYAMEAEGIPPIKDRKRFKALQDEKDRLDAEDRRIMRDMIGICYLSAARKLEKQDWDRREALRREWMKNRDDRDRVERELSIQNPFSRRH